MRYCCHSVFYPHLFLIMQSNVLFFFCNSCLNDFLVYRENIRPNSCKTCNIHRGGCFTAERNTIIMRRMRRTILTD